MTTRERRGAFQSRRPALRLAGLGAVAALAALHLEILAERLRDESLAEPAVALRWLLAAALLGAASAVRRRGVALLRGRAGLVLALAVLLLHVGAPSSSGTTPDLTALLAALPAGIALGGVVAGAAWRGRAPARRLAPRSGDARRDRRSRRPSLGGLQSHFVPRPPPRLALAAS